MLFVTSFLWYLCKVGAFAKSPWKCEKVASPNLALKLRVSVTRTPNWAIQWPHKRTFIHQKVLAFQIYKAFPQDPFVHKLLSSIQLFVLILHQWHLHASLHLRRKQFILANVLTCIKTIYVEWWQIPRFRSYSNTLCTPHYVDTYKDYPELAQSGLLWFCRWLFIHILRP